MAGGSDGLVAGEIVGLVGPVVRDPRARTRTARTTARRNSPEQQGGTVARERLEAPEAGAGSWILERRRGDRRELGVARSCGDRKAAHASRSRGSRLALIRSTTILASTNESAISKVVAWITGRSRAVMLS